jgi:hypothetical protein
MKNSTNYRSDLKLSTFEKMSYPSFMKNSGGSYTARANEYI